MCERPRCAASGANVQHRRRVRHTHAVTLSGSNACEFRRHAPGRDQRIDGRGPPIHARQRPPPHKQTETASTPGELCRHGNERTPYARSINSCSSLAATAPVPAAPHTLHSSRQSSALCRLHAVSSKTRRRCLQVETERRAIGERRHGLSWPPAVGPLTTEVAHMTVVRKQRPPHPRQFAAEHARALPVRPHRDFNPVFGFGEPAACIARRTPSLSRSSGDGPRGGAPWAAARRPRNGGDLPRRLLRRSC